MWWIWLFFQGSQAQPRVFLPQFQGMGIQLTWNGNQVEGWMDGRGKLLIAVDGRKIAEFKGTITRGQLEKGTFEVYHNQRYKGTFAHGLPEGTGRMEWAGPEGKFGLKSALIYEGNWLSGKMQGLGRLEQPAQKSYYYGSFENGVKHGFGGVFVWMEKPDARTKMRSPEYQNVVIQLQKNTTTHEYVQVLSGYWFADQYVGNEPPSALSKQTQ